LCEFLVFVKVFELLNEIFQEASFLVVSLSIVVDNAQEGGHIDDAGGADGGPSVDEVLFDHVLIGQLANENCDVVLGVFGVTVLYDSLYFDCLCLPIDHGSLIVPTVDYFLHLFADNIVCYGVHRVVIVVRTLFVVV
jgi:hypothetical protein